MIHLLAEAMRSASNGNYAVLEAPTGQALIVVSAHLA